MTTPTPVISIISVYLWYQVDYVSINVDNRVTFTNIIHLSDITECKLFIEKRIIS